MGIKRDKRNIIYKNEKIVCDATVFESIRKCKDQVYIWGNGSMAQFLKDTLLGDHIEVDGCLEGSTSEIQDICKKMGRVAIVIGHGHYEKSLELASSPYVVNVFVVPRPYLQYRLTKEKLEKFEKDIDEIKEHLSDDISRECLDIYRHIQKRDDITPLILHKNFVGNMFGFEKLYLTDGMNYSDIGAYDGDSIRLLQKYIKPGRIVAFEPDEDSFEKLEKFISANERMNAIKKGVSSKKGKLYLVNAGTQSAKLVAQEEISDDAYDELKTDYIELTTVDEEFPNKDIDLLKVSIPGDYTGTIVGARETIMEKRPKLIVNVGVDGSCILEAIRIIKSCYERYSIYLRYDFCMSTRLFLYAVDESV